MIYTHTHAHTRTYMRARARVYNKENAIFFHKMNSNRFYLQLIREFVFVIALFLCTSDNDYRCNAIKFWSNVVCYLENLKILHFYNVFDNSKSFILLEYSDVFIYDIARKCETTVILKTYVLRDPRNTFYSANGVVYGSVISSIQKIRWSEHMIIFQTMSSVEKISMQNNKEGNTQNIYVFLMRNIYSFDQILKNDSILTWNSRDRFIVLIIQSNEYNRLNKSNMKIDDILKLLWAKHKIQGVFVSNMMLVNNTSSINRIIRTYNPFAKINDSGL